MEDAKRKAKVHFLKLQLMILILGIKQAYCIITVWKAALQKIEK